MVVLPYDGPLRVELEAQKVQVVIHRRLPIVTRPQMRHLGGIAKLFLNAPISTLWVWRLARRFRADLIHTNTALILSPGPAAWLARVSHIWHVREFFTEFGKLWNTYQWYMNWLADEIVCVSTPVAQQYDSRIRAHKVRVIHNGLPLDEFGPVEAERVRAFRKQFGLGQNRLVGVVGRIKYGRKGQDIFVRAVAQLKDKFPDVTYVLIGSPFPGNEQHLLDLQALICEVHLEDRIIYTGDVADIKAAYAALDISVLPSALPEPFGGVVIESMAMGKPVVGTRYGGTLEQIDDGVTGYLVPPNDPTALAEALACLLRDDELRQRMGAAARERFLRLFEFELFYHKMLAVYERLTAS